MRRDSEAARVAAEYDHELATVMWQLGEDPAGNASDRAHEVARERLDRARRIRIDDAGPAPTFIERNGAQTRRRR